MKWNITNPIDSYSVLVKNADANFMANIIVEVRYVYLTSIIVLAIFNCSFILGFFFMNAVRFGRSYLQYCESIFAA